MRHQSHHVSAEVDDAGKVGTRAVGICGSRHLSLAVSIAEENLPVPFELMERCIVHLIVSLAVSDRDAQNLAGPAVGGKPGAGIFHAEMYLLAHERHAIIPEKRAGQEARFAQDLEAVARSEEHT